MTARCGSCPSRTCGGSAPESRARTRCSAASRAPPSCARRASGWSTTTTSGATAFGRALARRRRRRPARRRRAGSTARSAWAVVALGSYARRRAVPRVRRRRDAPASRWPADVLRMPTPPAGSGTRSGTPGSSLGQSVRTVKEASAVADERPRRARPRCSTCGSSPATRRWSTSSCSGYGSWRRGGGIASSTRWPTPRRRAFDQPGPDRRDARARPEGRRRRPARRADAGVGGLEPADPGRDRGGRTTVGRGTAASPSSSTRGYLQAGDPERLRDARALLLDARVALHRVTGGRSDRLPLQEQDAVAGCW